MPNLIPLRYSNTNLLANLLDVSRTGIVIAGILWWVILVGKLYFYIADDNLIKLDPASDPHYNQYDGIIRV